MQRNISVVLASLLIVGLANAENSENGEPGREHRGPPKEALEACSAAAKGDPCSFEDRRGETLAGSCDAPDGKPLACRPSGGPPDQTLRSQ